MHHAGLVDSPEGPYPSASPFRGFHPAHKKLYLLCSAIDWKQCRQRGSLSLCLDKGFSLFWLPSRRAETRPLAGLSRGSPLARARFWGVLSCCLEMPLFSVLDPRYSCCVVTDA